MLHWERHHWRVTRSTTQAKQACTSHILDEDCADHCRPSFVEVLFDSVPCFFFLLQYVHCYLYLLVLFQLGRHAEQCACAARCTAMPYACRLSRCNSPRAPPRRSPLLPLASSNAQLRTARARACAVERCGGSAEPRAPTWRTSQHSGPDRVPMPALSGHNMSRAVGKVVAQSASQAR